MEFKDFTTPHPDKEKFKGRVHRLADVLANDAKDAQSRGYRYHGLCASLGHLRYEISIDDRWNDRHWKMVLMKFELPWLIRSSRALEEKAQDYYKSVGHRLAKKN